MKAPDPARPGELLVCAPRGNLNPLRVKKRQIDSRLAVHPLPGFSVSVFLDLSVQPPVERWVDRRSAPRNSGCNRMIAFTEDHGY